MVPSRRGDRSGFSADVIEDVLQPSHSHSTRAQTVEALDNARGQINNGRSGAHIISTLGRADRRSKRRRILTVGHRHRRGSRLLSVGWARAATPSSRPGSDVHEKPEIRDAPRRRRLLVGHSLAMGISPQARQRAPPRDLAVTSQGCGSDRPWRLGHEAQRKGVQTPMERAL